MNEKPGCLIGLAKIFSLTWLFNWLQDSFGFGKGCSCSGIGCGLILLLLFLMLICSTITGTDWTKWLFELNLSLI